MKFDFNPKIELTEQERELLTNFSRAVEKACYNTSCDDCILAAVCNQHEDAVHFLDALFETLGIY